MPRSTTRFPGRMLHADWRSDGPAAALLLLAVALVWPYSLTGPFQFDDWNVIVDAPAVHSLTAWWQSMPGIRPLLKLSYALNWSRPDLAAGFHLVNLIIHAINGLLVWRLLLHWPQLGRQTAWWVALMFIVHPAQTEAVTYISGRSMSLMALFWLTAALCWVNGRRGAAVAFFLAALATRETAWSLPFVLIVWRRAEGLGWRESARQLWPLWVALGVSVLGLLWLPQYQRMLIHALTIRGPLDNLALQVHGVSYLLIEPLLLLQNNIDPTLPLRARFDFGWWSGLLAIVAIGAVGVRWLAQRPAFGLALCWPLLLLLPTNGLIARLDLASDRHLYLALIGPAALLCHGIASCCADRIMARACAGLALVCAVFTGLRIHDYRSESALWEATRIDSPTKARVWNNLGVAYLVEGRPDLARAALSHALTLDPGFMRAQLNLERAEHALGPSGDPAVTATLKNQ